MKKSTPLKPYERYENDLLYWVKAYIGHKVLELFKSSKENKVDDIIVYINQITNAKNFDELQVTCKELIKDGLKSLSKPLASMGKFYPYALNHTTDFDLIHDDFMFHFSTSLNLAASTKKTYLDSVLEFLTFIENTNTENFKFCIEYQEVRIKKPKPKVHDAMDEEEFLRFSKLLPTLIVDNEFEKCRMVLICRIMLYSGITPKELTGLKLGKSLIVDKKGIYLNLENRDIKIYLPRNKLIKYFHKYLELKKENKDGFFFYSLHDINKTLTTSQVNELVKAMLIKAKIERRELNATLLRVSLAVFLYNYRKDGKQFHLTSIQKILGQNNRAETENMIGFHAKEYAQINDVFLDENFD